MLQLHNTCYICTIAAATAFERYCLSVYAPDFLDRLDLRYTFLRIH